MLYILYIHTAHASSQRILHLTMIVATATMSDYPAMKDTIVSTLTPTLMNKNTKQNHDTGEE